jgi:putative zinc finger protein
MMTPDPQAGRHLDSGEVASYLDRALAPTEQARLEAHLAECAECRGELIEVSRLRHARARSRWWIVGPAVAAAAVGLFFVTRPADTPGPVLRDGGEPSLPTIALVTPADSAAASATVAFTWRSVGAGASYRLAVTDERGDIVWSETSADTTGRPPGSVSLRTGRLYFWYVDALLPDGRSVTSGARRFTVR